MTHKVCFYVMRTTIRLNDNLFAQLKAYAGRTGRTLTSVIEDALRAYLTTSKPQSRKQRVRLTTVRGRGVQPGVDLDSASSLLDLMERQP